MSSKKSIGLVLVILGFILIALTGLRTISNPEIFTHIALGQADTTTVDPVSYTMDGQNWINLHPLYNKVAATLWSMGGAPLVTLVHVALVLAALILFFRLGKNWGGPTSQGLALLICAWLLQPVFTPGPAAFAMLFIALFVTLLHRTKNIVILAASLLILQVLWANIHPSFIIGPVLILFFAIVNQQAGRTASRVSTTSPLTTGLAGLAGAALLVTLANPSFFKLHTYIASHWFLLIRADVSEWISLFSGGVSYGFTEKLYFFSLLLCAGGLITLQKKLPPTITMLALVGASVSAISFSRGGHSIRALAAFAVLALPFMILSLNAVGEYLTHSLISSLKVPEKVPAYGSTGITLLLMLITAGALVTNSVYVGMGSASAFGLGVAEEAFPSAAAEVLNRDDFPEKILNVTHDGGYLAVHHPGRRAFCDNRLAFCDKELAQTIDGAFLGRPAAWNTIMNDWNPHAIVLNGTWPNSGALANRLTSMRSQRQQVWKLVYFDGSTIILVRNLPAYESLITDTAVQTRGLSILNETQQNYAERAKSLFKPGNSPRLVGAANFYLSPSVFLIATEHPRMPLLIYPKQAEPLYRTLTRTNPNMASAWLGLGESLILQKKLSDGLKYMERAAQIQPNNSLIWMGLYKAYALKGDTAKVAEAKEKLNRFFEADKATIEQQNEAAGKKQADAPKELPRVDGEPSLPKELR